MSTEEAEQLGEANTGDNARGANPDEVRRMLATIERQGERIEALRKALGTIALGHHPDPTGLAEGALRADRP